MLYCIFIVLVHIINLVFLVLILEDSKRRFGTYNIDVVIYNEHMETTKLLNNPWYYYISLDRLNKHLRLVC